MDIEQSFVGKDGGESERKDKRSEVSSVTETGKFCSFHSLTSLLSLLPPRMEIGKIFILKALSKFRWLHQKDISIRQHYHNPSQ